jgi:predicted transcriptional regulator
MSKMENILISLEPRYAEKILDGSKRVELRRRKMHVSPGATIWMYAKLPVGSVVGNAKIEQAASGSPNALWKSFGGMSGVSRAEFFSYFDGVKQGVALVLTDVVRLKKELPLQDLRRRGGGFHPPQFFSRLQANHPILSSAVTRRTR